MPQTLPRGVMFNAYPDSIGRNLAESVGLSTPKSEFIKRVIGMPGDVVEIAGADVAERFPVDGTVEPGTPFAVMRRRGRLRELPEQDQAELFLLTHTWLAAHGYEPYEACNFATDPAHRSRHNPKYWRHLPYLGLGPSAHSYLEPERYWSHRSVATYMRQIEAGKSAMAEKERLTQEQMMIEEG